MVHVVDVHVGKRIRQRRWLTGMTQQKLAELVGIKFQQIQKYETGANRVSASRLWDMSQILDVPVSYFFDDMSETTSVFGDRVNSLIEMLAVQETDGRLLQYAMLKIYRVAVGHGKIPSQMA